MKDWLKEFLDRRRGLADGPIYFILPPIPGLGGISLWPIGIFMRRKYNSDELFATAKQAHEQYHWDEQKAWPLFSWYIAYLLTWVFSGIVTLVTLKSWNPLTYRYHPMEWTGNALEDWLEEDAARKPTDPDAPGFLQRRIWGRRGFEI